MDHNYVYLNIINTRVHFLFKFINKKGTGLCNTDTYMQKIGTNQSFAQRKVLSFDKICFCVPTQVKFVKKKARKVCRDGKIALPLQCYPENNLFTLEN